MFDQAKLATVAYAAVHGADGSSSLMNSGITTSKISTGLYALTLPSGEQGEATLQQPAATDLVIITPTITSSLLDGFDASREASYVVNNTDATTKYVQFANMYDPVNTDFTVVIMRSLEPAAPY